MSYSPISVKTVQSQFPASSFPLSLSELVQNSDWQEKLGCHLWPLPQILTIQKMSFSTSRGGIWDPTIFKKSVLLPSNLWENRTIPIPQTLTFFHFIQNLWWITVTIITTISLCIPAQPLISGSRVTLSTWLTPICKTGTVMSLLYRRI